MTGNTPAQGSAGIINGTKPLIMKETANRFVNIQSPLLFDTLIPAFSRGEKEILSGALNNLNILHLAFRPSLAEPQSQNIRKTAVSAVGYL